MNMFQNNLSNYIGKKTGSLLLPNGVDSDGADGNEGALSKVGNGFETVLGSVTGGGCTTCWEGAGEETPISSSGQGPVEVWLQWILEIYFPNTAEKSSKNCCWSLAYC